MFFEPLPHHHKSKVRIDIRRRRSQRTGCAVGDFGADEALLFFGHVTELGPVTTFIGVEIQSSRISGLGFEPVSEVPRPVTALDVLTKTRVMKSHLLRGLKQVLTAC